MKENIGVLGGGSWGSTITNIVTENNFKVIQWLRDKQIVDEINQNKTNTKYLTDYIKLNENIEATTDLEFLAKSCKTILIALPSEAMRKVMYNLGNFVTGEYILVHATKGVEENPFKRMSEVIKEETCCKKIGVLSGPNLSKEIIQKQPAATIVASNFKEVTDKTREVLTCHYFRVYGSMDVIGTEIGGSLKNIIALAAGAVNGLGYGDNAKAFLLTRGLIEIKKFGEKFGADPETFNGLAGMGDLMTTCASKFSRNYQVGFRIAKGEKLEDIRKSILQTAEGVSTTKIVHNLAKKFNVYMPITEAVYQLLYEDLKIEEAVHNLMSIEVMYESD